MNFLSKIEFDFIEKNVNVSEFNLFFENKLKIMFIIVLNKIILFVEISLLKNFIKPKFKHKIPCEIKISLLKYFSIIFLNK